MSGNMRRLAGAVLAAAVVTGCAGGATPIDTASVIGVAPPLRLNAEFLASFEAVAVREVAEFRKASVRARLMRLMRGRFNITYDGETTAGVTWQQFVLRGLVHSDGRVALAHGEGVMTVFDSNKVVMRYEGGFQAGNLRGQGVLTVSDGTRAQGEFRGENLHGHGVISYPDGTRIEGEFRGGKQHGHGVRMYPDGRRDEGGFRDGKPHGHGVITMPDGERIEGEWRNGKRVR